MKKINMFGVAFDNYDFKDLQLFMDNQIAKKSPSYIVTCNVDHIMKLQSDEEFSKVYNQADLVVADGVPIIWASKLLGTPLKEKVSGSDIIPNLAEHFEDKRYKLYFLGAGPGVASKAKENLLKDYPQMQIVGTYSPTYGFEKKPDEINEIINDIKAKKPDILFVGVGAPKQEKWIYEHYQELNVPVSLGIGATIDFLAGNVRRAPVFMQKAGLEWFWRLMQEPKRLWKRYLVEDSQFLLMVLKEIFNKNRRRS
ncbi:WecB/TagA/CpsF family glycosyltransferase [Robertmurraya sp. GLU-23]